MYFIAAILPVAYVVGLIFTFKTHAHIFTQDEESGEEGDGSPAWSIRVNIVCILFSLISSKKTRDLAGLTAL